VNIISKAFIKDGMSVPMNYHFTTMKAHILRFFIEELEPTSNWPTKLTEKLKEDLEALDQKEAYTLV